MNKKIIIAVIVFILIMSMIGYYIINKININKRLYQIEEISDNKFFISERNDKYGVIDNHGKKVVDTVYDKIEIPNPSKDIFVCYKGDKGIVMNASNQQLFLEYNSIEAIELKNIPDSQYEKSVLKCEKDGKYGLINFSGKKILNLEYDSIEEFANIEGMLEIKQNDKVGVVNIKGTILVKPQYDIINSDGYYDEDNKYQQSGYIVGIKNEDGYKYGYINSQGKAILKIEYNDISRITDIPYSDGIYLVAAKNGQYGVIKNNKNILEHEYQEIEYDDINDILIIQKGKNYGVSNLSGKIIIPIQNTSIQAKGEYIYAERNNSRQVYDASGNKVQIDFDTSIMPTTNPNYKIVINSEENKNHYGVIGANNKQIIQPRYLYIEYAFDNYFIACGQDGKLGIIDISEKEAVELKYDLVQKVQGKDLIQTLSREENVTELYSKDMKKICEIKNAIIDNQNNYIKIYSDKELRYFDSEGKAVNYSQLFPENKIYASVKDEKWGYVNEKEKIVVNHEYEFCTDINQFGYAAVKKDGRWGCIDFNGNIIVEPKFELNENYSKVVFIGEYIKIDNGFGDEYYTNEI